MQSSNEMIDWPDSFREAAANPPAGFRVSPAVLDPVVHICEEDGAYHAQLCGILRGPEGVTLVPAVKAGVAYIAKEGVLRPLPVDCGDRFANMMGGRDHEMLRFSDVLEIVRNSDESLPVQVADSVYESASQSARKLQPEAIPGLKATLYPYQAIGVAWMHSCLGRNRGLILADEMGLGKTIQIIGLLLLDPPSASAPALIVCPTTLIANWCREIDRFGPSLHVMVHRGPNRTGDYRKLMIYPVTITTYETMAGDISLFRSVQWSYVIADEAQAMKNPESQRRRAAVQLTRQRTIAVTGTPVENSLADFWSLSDFAIPGILGSESEFSSWFPHTADGARQLSRIAAPFVIRRRLADVASDLPERINCDVPLELTEELARMYEEVRREVKAQYPFAAALVATGQLQLFCAHPWLRGTEFSALEPDENAEWAEETQNGLLTPKVVRTIEILEEAFSEGKKVLVFSVFNKIGRVLAEAGGELPTAFWGTINGSTDPDLRQKIVDEFSAYRGPGVLVLNPKAAGTGLNITAATVVIHFTQVWNPAVEAQASARAHRRGQTMPVTVYRLFYEDTVERIMLDRLAWKSDLANDAVPVGMRDESADLTRALEISPVQ